MPFFANFLAHRPIFQPCIERCPGSRMSLLRGFCQQPPAVYQVRRPGLPADQPTGQLEWNPPRRVLRQLIDGAILDAPTRRAKPLLRPMSALPHTDAAAVKSGQEGLGKRMSLLRRAVHPVVGAPIVGADAVAPIIGPGQQKLTPDAALKGGLPIPIGGSFLVQPTKGTSIDDLRHRETLAGQTPKVTPAPQPFLSNILQAFPDHRIFSQSLPTCIGIPRISGACAGNPSQTDNDCHYQRRNVAHAECQICARLVVLEPAIGWKYHPNLEQNRSKHNA